ncbi:MAG: DUF5815 family protein [Haloferacaceae archaeon]
MSQPRVPGDSGDTLELPCGERLVVTDLDLGMREFACDCGKRHAVVMDVHPATRFLPEFLVDVLREATETTSEEMPEFDTAHLMGMVIEEFPGSVVSHDASDEPDVGCGLLWIAEFDSRRLHEIVVELVVELMEHAVSHGDEDALAEFERDMLEFDVSAFVEQYRGERDFEAEGPYG